MSGDIEGWLNIVDRLDVWGLAIMVLIGGWKIVRSLDRIERSMAIHAHEIKDLNAWRGDHTQADREEHRRIYDKIAEQR